jgi:gamma-glutamyltranspeptidase/glutathione hydrolase
MRPVAILLAPALLLAGLPAQEGGIIVSRTMRPVVRGRLHAVASMKHEASMAAFRVLEAGGNAFDAAVAGQAALAVVDAASNGVGSDAVALVYDASAKKVFSINAEGTAPRLATIEWYRKNSGGIIPDSDGLLSASLPGIVDAWYLLLDRWGTMTFEQVLASAIDLAENGFPLGDALARNISGSRKLRKYPSSVRVYLPNGKAPRPGDIFRNPDLGRTLRKLIEAEREHAPQGRRQALRAARDRFYKGDIARTFAEFSENNGGLYRYEDFATYTAKIETPVSIVYRGWQVFKNPSSNQGPAELFALKILSGFDLRAMAHNGPDFIHASAEAIKLAMGDREKYLADDDFIKIPWAGLLSDAYADERRKQIDPAKASHELRPGVPEKYMEGAEPVVRPLDINISGKGDHEGDTSYIAVVDRQRNMVTLTPSLHSGFGTGVVMADTGIIFNCRGDYYSLTPGHANALEPGKRPRSTLQGTLVLKDGKPAMVMGSPGGDDQCMRTMQTFINLVDFGMNVQQAIEAPRWTTRSFPASPFPHTMYPGDLGIEDRIGVKVRDALEARGHKVSLTGAWSLGSNAAIVVDPETGVLHAGADPRVEAFTLAR